MAAWYNENNLEAAAVLRQQITDGVIAPGDVDTRSIKDIQPDDIRPYTQCHFFAGGGLWSVAARMAGWADARSLWTGSCPCQPFSSAGKRHGIDDPRHLWPDFYRLIRACRPAVVMGEQIAGKAGDIWIDRVFFDLEEEGYACRAIDIPACAINLPHIRERRWFVADADSLERRPGVVEGRGARLVDRREARNRSRWPPASQVPRVDDGVPGGMALRRISGNAIVPVLAAQVIAAFMEA